MTTTPITSINDELLAEIERDFSALTCSLEFGEETTRKAAGVCLMAAELRRLRAEVEALKTDLKTSRADEMQAMRWLTEMRFASGDDGKLMLPEIVAHIEALRGDKELLDWLADPENEAGNVQLPTKCVMENMGSLRDAIRQAMQSNTEGN